MQKPLRLTREEKNESQMLHFNSEVGKCQLVFISEPSAVGVVTLCPF